MSSKPLCPRLTFALASFFAATLLTFLAVAPVSADEPLQTPFVKIIALGDSYSDDGFADGFGFMRYTETTTWVEQLAAALNLPLENRAWGGAMSNQRNCNHAEGVDWSGLDWQIDDYLKNVHPGEDLSKILFTVMVGSNDVWAGIDDGAVTAANIEAALTKLVKAGARYILYRETSAVLLSPGYLAGDYVKYAEPWTKLVNVSNQLTAANLAKALTAAAPDVQVFYHPSDPLFEKVKNGEAGFKFEILDTAWWGTYEYPQPNKWLWYDAWHPMGAFHELLAQDSLERLKAELQK
jgi:phospholipase/lecithinase/hemolysin